MMNNRFEKQNEEYMLKCLFAQRQEYSVAKKMNNITLFLVILSVVFAVLTARFDDPLLLAVSNMAAVFIIVANKYIDKKVVVLKKSGASLQQYFDAHFFSYILGRDLLIWSNIPNQTDVDRKIANIHSTDTSKERNWYSDYSKLDEEQQVFCCQVQNVEWDIKLRKVYEQIIIILGVLSLCIIFFALRDFTVLKMINIIALIVPLIEYNINIVVSVRKDINRLKKIEERQKLVEKRLNDTNVDKKQKHAMLSNLQDCIMENRIEATLIPDRFYSLMQKRYQEYEDRVAKNITDRADKGSSR